jgi:hypothetical protein
MLSEQPHVIEMRIDLIGQIVELAPGLAKVRRFVSRLQQFAILPLDVVDDAPPIEAAVQADRDKTRLTRHEMRSLCHQRKRLLLLFRLDFNEGDLRDRLIVFLDAGHGALPFVIQRSNSPG